MTRIFFPLRTSVEFFPDPMSVEASARAKEASILYDEVVFEAALYDIGITEVGSFANGREPGGLTPQELARSRQLPEPGSGMRISFGLQPGPDEPAPPEAMHMAFEGPLVASYVSEWHTGVIDELKQLRPNWAFWTIWEEADPEAGASEGAAQGGPGSASALQRLPGAGGRNADPAVVPHRHARPGFGGGGEHGSGDDGHQAVRTPR